MLDSPSSHHWLVTSKHIYIIMMNDNIKVARSQQHGLRRCKACALRRRHLGKGSAETIVHHSSPSTSTPSSCIATMIAISPFIVFLFITIILMSGILIINCNLESSIDHNSGVDGRESHAKALHNCWRFWSWQLQAQRACSIKNFTSVQCAIGSAGSWYHWFHH